MATAPARRPPSPSLPTPVGPVGIAAPARPAAPVTSCCAGATSAPPASAAGTAPTRGSSAWDRPKLVNPITLVPSYSNRGLKLDPNRDYIVKIPAGGVEVPTDLSIYGGHNVVLDGGHITVDDSIKGALRLLNQTGEIWVHNVHLSGPNLEEGIDMDERQPQSTVVLRNVLVDRVHGSLSTNHADLIQTWAGPSRLLVDGFSGTTDYQGFFLMPNQQFNGPPPKLFDLRHVDIADDGGYALWRDFNNPFRLLTQDVYVRPNPAKPGRDWFLWPKPSTGDSSWSSVAGAPPQGGSFVQETADGASGVSDAEQPQPATGEEPW